MRLLAAAAVLAVAAAAVSTKGLANGDPASDVLYTRNVFLPYPSPSKATATALERAVAAAFARRYRVKVAVIVSPPDLGSVPELFNKPVLYARFLGQELSPVFVGPLLIVMPAGFGIYDGGRSTKAEERVLASLQVSGDSSEPLTQIATTAIQKLTATGALRSRDIRPPSVVAEVTTTSPGVIARLRYTVVEDSERSREVVRVWSGKKLRATIRTRFHAAHAQVAHVVQWRVPKRVAQAKFRFCVVGIDPTGNVGRKACAQIVVVQ